MDINSRIIKIKNIASILSDVNVNKYRNKIEIVRLIDLYIKFNQEENLYALITDKNLLKYRNNNEQIMLIDEYINLNDINLPNNISYNIIINPNIIKKSSINEHLDFVKSYSILPNEIVKNRILEILSNELLFERRKISAIEEMLNIYLATENEYIYKYIQIPYIITYETSAVHIRLLQNMRDNLIKENIKELRELRELVENLKNELYLEEASKPKK